MLNLTYIKAAIEYKLGIKIRLKDVARYLVEEGLTTQDQANRAVFFGYESINTPLHPSGFPPKKEAIKPVDQELDKWEPIEKDELNEEEDV